MASPRPTAAPTAAPATQPLTPPADPPSTANNTSQTGHPATAAANAAANNPAIANPVQVPSTSLDDSGKTRRPRDARLIHMLLASLGVTAYQERVPLQLLDFAYRYTSSTLQDAVYLATEGYAGAHGEGSGGGTGRQHINQDVNSVSLAALRLSIASRLHYQFQPGLPKEFLMDVAAERNRIALPGVSRGVDTSGSGAAAAASAGTAGGVMMGGLRLPPERFCQTGVGWQLKEAWESDGEEEFEVEDEAKKDIGGGEEATGEDEGDGKMEDVFGEDAMDEDVKNEDKDMTDV